MAWNSTVAGPLPRYMVLLLGWFAITMATLVMPLVAGAQPATETPKIDWKTNYHEGLAQAEEQKKPVLIDFYASWCGPCTAMEKQVFTDPAVIKAMQDFVNIKIDIDADEKTAFAYGVQSIPRTVVLNIHGEVVGDRVGFMESEAYIAFLKDAGEYIHRKVDGTVITVPQDAPEKVAFALDAELADVMKLLAAPEPAVREKARKAVLRLDPAVVERWMRQGLASDYLGERIAAKETLAALDPKAAEGFDPWASAEDRARMLAALE